MGALEKIKQGKRLTAAFLYELLYGIANGDLATENNFAWQQSTTAASHALKINTATNAGALSQIEYAFKVEVYG